MSDVLSPAEQARAARWAADWLERGFDDEHPVTALNAYADRIDPPDSVEFLRAERDEALAERDEALAEMEEVGAFWRQERIMHQKAWATIRNLQAEVAGLRTTHVEAEAAWGRCQRED